MTVFLGLVAAMALLIAGGGPEVGTASGARLAELALAGLCGFVAALLGLSLLEGRTGRARWPELAGHARSETPMALTDIAGRLLWKNDALERLAGPDASETIEAALVAYGPEPAEIYRTARAALAEGFGFTHLRAAGEQEGRYLTARLREPRRILWGVVPEERMSGLLLSGLPTAFSVLPVPHLRLAGEDAVVTNAAFRETFGTDPAPVIRALCREGAPRPGRFLLPLGGGGASLARVFLLEGAERARRGVRDVLLFPLDGDEIRANAPMAGIEQIPVAMIQLDLTGRILWRNTLADEMLSGRPEPGRRLDTLLESLGPPLPVIVDAVASGARPTRGEMMRLIGAETETFIDVELTRVDIDGQATLMAVLTDANELRQLEDKFAQSQKMEAVGKLAGGVAHDFNNVLTAISGHCDLMLLGKDDSHPDYSDLIQVRQNANRAAGLVRQLLAFSRKQTLNPKVLNLHDVVSDTLYLLDRLIGERINLVLDHGADLLPVRADRQQLEQALMNLVVNARDAMPDGGTVTIATANRVFGSDRMFSGTLVTAGTYVEVAVFDEGEGIEPSIIGRVFDPFFTTKPQGEGTGLGLSTVYGIVKQSGGYIFTENRDTGGAVFRILLPRVADDPGAVPEPASSESERRGDATGQASVLLVEDEAPVRAFAARALALRGYVVTEAASAEEAMQVLADPARQVDVIVSDVVMPGMDGPSFVREARALRPDLKVIFVSGYAEEGFRKSLLDPEFSFLPKPFSLSELTGKVKEVLEAP